MRSVHPRNQPCGFAGPDNRRLNEQRYFMALWEGFLPANWVRARIADIGAVRCGRQHSPDKQSDRLQPDTFAAET